MLATLDAVVAEATAALEASDHARALELAESFFWTFCDDYLELVKERAYDSTHPGQASAALALRTALSIQLRLLAPVIVFATEEVWSWFESGSVHTAPWPVATGAAGDPGVLAAVSEALVGVRRAKTEAKASQKTPVRSLTLGAPDAARAALALAEGDLKAVERIATVLYADADTTGVVAIELEEA
jgi:valyl-tRNA synthetase